MRTPVLAAVLAGSLLMLNSCEAHFDWPWLEKKASAERVSPSGEEGTQDREIGSFESVTLDGVGRLVFDSEIPQGTIRLVADTGVFEAIQTVVSDQVLTIREEGIHMPDTWDLEFRVAPPKNLSGVTLAGLGTIESATSFTTEVPLTVTIQGMGKIHLAVSAPQVVVNQNGSGEMILKGTAASVQVFAQGLGKVDVKELIAESADVLSQGVGEVEVYASKSLKVRAQGLGAVHFYGNPANTDVQTEGMTKVSAQN